MKYFAARRSFLLESPAVDASCAAIGAWYRLQSYATSDDVESPALVGARLWSARRWGSLQLRIADVNCAVKAGLAAWDGDDLRVDVGFDAEGFSMLLKSRRIAQQNGRLGGRPKVVEIIESTEPTSEPLLKPTDNQLSSDLISSPLTPSDLPLGIGGAGGKGKPGKQRSGPDYPPDFEAFWSATGKCHGNKLPALDAWNQWADRYDLPKMTAAWAAYMKSSGPAKGAVFHVSTWLNQRGWETEWSAQPAIAPPSANGSARNGTQKDIRYGHTMADGQVHKGGGVVKDF